MDQEDDVPAVNHDPRPMEPHRGIVGLDVGSDPPGVALVVGGRIALGAGAFVALAAAERARNVNPVDGTFEPLRSFVPGDVEATGLLTVEEMDEFRLWGPQITLEDAFMAGRYGNKPTAWAIQAAHYLEGLGKAARRYDREPVPEQPPEVQWKGRRRSHHGGRPSSFGAYKGTKEARKASRPKKGPGKRSKRPTGGAK